MPILAIEHRPTSIGNTDCGKVRTSCLEQDLCLRPALAREVPGEPPTSPTPLSVRVSLLHAKVFAHQVLLGPSPLAQVLPEPITHVEPIEAHLTALR